MKENNNKEINYTKLAFLRKNTILGPIALLKIQSMKNDTEEFRKWYYQMEGEILSSDYTIADELEYKLRLKVWEGKVAPVWQKHGQEFGLTEFAEMVMDQQMEKSKNKSR